MRVTVLKTVLTMGRAPLLSRSCAVAQVDAPATPFAIIMHSLKESR